MKPYSRVILLLLVLQAGVTGFLIWLSLASNSSEDTFALFLTVDLVAFAMVTYIFRTERVQAVPNPLWLFVGLGIIVAIFFASLSLA
jgi:hypothetical protein